MKAFVSHKVNLNQIKTNKMTSIILKLSECKTGREVDAVVDNYIFKLAEHQRSHLSIMANKAKRRIQIVQREKIKSFGELNN